MQIESFSEKDTFELGRKIGEKAGPGQIYTLDGDLGVGKTVFTKGLAWGLGLGRAAMRRFKIADLRLMFENDVRFLEQF